MQRYGIMLTSSLAITIKHALEYSCIYGWINYSDVDEPMDCGTDGHQFLNLNKVSRAQSSYVELTVPVGLWISVLRTSAVPSLAHQLPESPKRLGLNL